eukprot:CAMPEP_0117591764 /NCGR_PEP_ID=MMETSP0784-20121206/71719_1 /TAXON_ID=39447 /ORGANISM="" /LENGTH=49 /DNA_ID= /DNA_START= /DNA_END= /DNA_ORIENTATION=
MKLGLVRKRRSKWAHEHIGLIPHRTLILAVPRSAANVARHAAANRRHTP